MKINIYDKKTINKFEQSLNVDLEGENIVIYGNRRPNRKTYHNKNEKFIINTRSLKHILTIMPKAIEIWENVRNRYSLFAVQNAVNVLMASYQEINEDNVLLILNKSK